MLTPAAFRALRRGRQRGQALVLMVLFVLLLFGIAGLAADGGHVYLSKRDVQNAADAAALAAGQRLSTENPVVLPTASDSTSTDAPVLAANAFAANNGYTTTYGTTCDHSTSTQFSTTWVNAGSCSSLSTATTVVTVNDPPETSPDGQLPPTACSLKQGVYPCLQVIIQSKVRNYIMGVFGIPSTTVTASAVVDASNGTPGTGTLPPSNTAVYLYQPHSAFDAAQTPALANLGCSTSCPTYWTMDNGQPTFNGITGSASVTDAPALQSNGDMLIDGQTTFCDPTGGTCQGNHDVGSDGWAINGTTGSLYYCSQLNNVNPGGCTTTGQAHLDQMWGSKTSFTAQTWTPTIPSQTNDCSSLDLVLNGQTVTSAAAGTSCVPNASEPYTIIPGIYHSITINHGAYEFGPGVFDIKGSAPVNTNGPSSGCAGNHSYTANGIDHCNETTNNDVDLCNGNQSAVACPTLTAGVWIGHGGGNFTAASNGTSGACTGGGTDSDGGGGDQTQVTGSGVTFILETSGFVSTDEVSLVNLESPGTSTTSSPILLDDLNNSFMHLDVGNPPGGGAFSQLNGIIYQTPSATAGGVQFDAGFAHNQGGAIVGQVLAYSMQVWGKGTAVDFSAGWGVNTPQVPTSGNNEQGLIGTPAPTAPVASGTYAGDEVFTVNYTDEWALDAYDVYIRINGGAPVFFSQNEWGPQPGANVSLPPEGSANTNPNDNANPSWPEPGTTTPTYPAAGTTYTFPYGASSTGYTVAADAKTGANDDWTEQIGSGSSTSYLEVLGAWTWGHQKDIGTSNSGAYNATIRYTFPTPPGSTIGITIFMTDGDHCGDYATASYTLSNASNGGPGSPGTVALLQ